jgi:predicted Rossmann fold nucleotide-binding protein DprA/Smf involved in DNA uptake
VGAVVSVGGSVSLGVGGLAAVGSVAGALLSRGFSLAVGCACGADLAFVNYFISRSAASRVSVFAAGAASGSGFLSPLSAPALRSAESAGARVLWLAGGPLSVPLRARLSLRARACVSVGASAAFVVTEPDPASGSLKALAFAACLGHPVFVVPVGFAPAALPCLPGRSGRWLHSAGASALFGLPCWSWLEATHQETLVN